MAGITEEDCQSVLGAYLKGQPFKVDNFNYKPFNEIMGLHGCHGLLEIGLEGRDGSLRFFVKSPTSDEKLFKKYFQVNRCFEKERLMITRVLVRLQRRVKPKLAAECFFAGEGGLLVMEDLSSLGYEVQRCPVVDFRHAEAALRALATLHAASLIEEELTGVPASERYKEIDCETFFVDHPVGFECLVNSMNDGLVDLMAKYFPEIADEEREALARFMREGATTYGRLSTEERRVVTHGDPWGNNILYKYDDEGRPREVCMVDFQGSRLVPPAFEVIEYLYLAGGEVSAEAGRKRLQGFYYEALGEALAAEGLDLAGLLPRAEYDRGLVEYERFAVCIRLYYFYTIRIPRRFLNSVVPDTEAYIGMMLRGDSTVARLAFEGDDGYREEMTRAFGELVEFWKRATGC